MYPRRPLDLVTLAAFCVLACSPLVLVSGRLASFVQDFRITWADSHIRQINGGEAIQLMLDQSSGSIYIHIHAMFDLTKSRA